jgi:hypothetical protein
MSGGRDAAFWATDAPSPPPLRVFTTMMRGTSDCESSAGLGVEEEEELRGEVSGRRDDEEEEEVEEDEEAFLREQRRAAGQVRSRRAAHPMAVTASAVRRYATAMAWGERSHGAGSTTSPTAVGSSITVVQRKIERVRWCSPLAASAGGAGVFADHQGMRKGACAGK